MKANEKAQGFSVNDLATLAVILITVGLVFAYGLEVLTDTRDTIDSGNKTSGYQTDAWLAGNNATNALNEVSTRLPTIAGIIAVIVILYYVGMMRNAV